jgi:maltose O-acetyltransferase
MIVYLIRVAEAAHERLTRRRNRVLFSRCEGGGGVNLGPDVWWNFHVVHPERLSFGEGTVLNGECYINAQGGVRFGRFCHVGKGLTVYSSNHNYLSEVAIPYDERDILKPVEIGDCVWIGANVSLLPGTRIGPGAIVSMGSVVRGEVPSCAIVAGNPAKVVGTRDPAVFKRLYEAKAFA